jgi:hypothetical protein
LPEPSGWPDAATVPLLGCVAAASEKGTVADGAVLQPAKRALATDTRSSERGIGISWTGTLWTTIASYAAACPQVGLRNQS